MCTGMACHLWTEQKGSRIPHTMSETKHIANEYVEVKNRPLECDVVQSGTYVLTFQTDLPY